MFKRIFQSALVSIATLSCVLTATSVASAHHGNAVGACINNQGVITAKFEAFGDRANLLGKITVKVNNQKVDEFTPTADNFTRTYKSYTNGSYSVVASWVMDWNKNGKVDQGESFGFTNTVKIEKCEPKVEKCAVPGKEHLPKNDPNCKEDEKCLVTGKTHLPKNDPACKEEPKVLTATTLPNTGIPTALLLSLPVLAVIGGYFFSLRRSNR